MDLLKTLIISSEKAANIARLLRQNEKLFEKVVEQKSSEEANPRFQEDFKTLADVLIQEMVKHDVGLKFPSIKEKVQGEENNRFHSKELNKDIIVEVKDSKEETASILAELLEDSKEIADLLTEEVYRDVCIEEINTRVPDGDEDIDIDRLGIWIDPIDGTNEYVKGGYEDKMGDFYTKGLKCVTVLIGAYDIDSGQPVLGVINQPFFEKGIDKGYQCNWGLCNSIGYSVSSLGDTSDWSETNIICVGASEDQMILNALKNGGYELVISRGAGYKLLTVVLGMADAYLLSKPTTFFWDTCGPHAILKAVGGNIVEMVGVKSNESCFVTYQENGCSSKCHVNGIIAYRSQNVLENILKLEWKN